MLPIIRFIVYEIDSKVCYICRKDKIEKDIPVKSWILVPENDLEKLEINHGLIIPEIFMQ
ncbi:MAG: hypothetical protein NTX43_12985 [Bacteroidetes bacterium]|nr:hypothetical protein [Bacteroidota bacterium]